MWCTCTNIVILQYTYTRRPKIFFIYRLCMRVVCVLNYYVYNLFSYNYLFLTFRNIVFIFYSAVKQQPQHSHQISNEHRIEFGESPGRWRVVYDRYNNIVIYYFTIITIIIIITIDTCLVYLQIITLSQRILITNVSTQYHFSHYMYNSVGVSWLYPRI